MDLALWIQKDAHIGLWTRLRLGLGAKPYRCEYCRINFASFRARHERFAFNRWTKRNQNGAEPDQQEVPR